MTLRFRAGFHLGNWGTGPLEPDIRLIQETKAGALLAMHNIQPQTIEFWAKENPNGYIILRNHFDHSGIVATGAAVMNWANGQCEMIDRFLHVTAFRDLYEKGLMGAKVFNEPNMPGRLEGFGNDDVGMRAYNNLFPQAANFIKQRFPKINIIGYSMTPGNMDVYFPTDAKSTHYWLHGPEAAKDNPTQIEVNASIQSCLTVDAKSAMDWFGCHIYPHPGTWDAPHLGRRFEKYWKFLPTKLINNTFILEASAADAAGQDVRAVETVKWLNMLQQFPQVKAVTLWWLRNGDGTWEKHFYTEPSGDYRKIAYAIKDFNNQEVVVNPPTQPPAPVPTNPPATPIKLPNGVTLNQAIVQPNQEVWRLTRFEYQDELASGGRHHIDIIQPHDSRSSILITNTSTRETFTLPLDKPLTEPAQNHPMYGIGNVYSAKMTGLPSDEVLGMTMPGNRHVVYQLWFTKVKEQTSQPPVPTPPTEEVTNPVDFIRNSAWSDLGIARNKEAYFFKYAFAHQLGRPVSNEKKVTIGKRNYLYQSFDKGIIFAEVSANEIVNIESTSHIDWL
jgi:hypothetical protein